MAEELRLALILLGTLAIGSVILHGIWTVRRTVSEERKNAKMEAKEAETEIAPEEQEMQKLKLKQMEMNFSELQLTKSDPSLTGVIPVKKMNLDSIYHKDDQQDISVGLSERAGESKQQGFNVDVVDVDDSFTNQFEIDDEDYEQSIILTDVLEDDDEHKEPSFQSEPVSHTTNKLEASPCQAESKEVEKQEVFILYIDKSDGTPIDGAKLLPLLLTLGFKYGEMDFFHRHQDNTGRGDILFSLANMFNPGTFDIDNMEQVATRGLTIFMTLPNNAAPLPTFNMMHNAAKKIAEEFSAVVLDDQRRPLDVAIVRSYVERIRRF